MKKNGYTLIELLVAIAIVTVIGTIAVSVLTLTLRGSKRATATEAIRQNGDAALTQMVRVLRYAKSLDSPTCNPSSTASSVTVTSLSNTQTTFSCNSTGITANGNSMLDMNTVSVKNCSFVCQSSNQQPTVTIQFTLTSPNSNSLLENTVSIPFETTVSLRNASLR